MLASKVKPKWVFVKTDQLWPEIKLFVRSFNFAHSSWQERCDRWKTHVNVFASLKGGVEGDWKAIRISFLFEHLGILDTKFNVLLALNTLLLVAFNVLLNFLLNRRLVTGTIETLGVLFGVFWLVTTIICLIGERRLVWGDLGLVGGSRLTWNDFKEPAQFVSAEEGHVKALIIAVAKRTNKLRVAIGLTYVNVALLALTFIAALARVPHIRNP